MFVRAATTDAAHGVPVGEICLCTPSGAVNLGSDWPAVVAAYGAAKVPLVIVESDSMLERFTKISLSAVTLDGGTA